MLPTLRMSLLAGTTYVFSKFKKFLSRTKVAYLASKDQGKTKEDDITRMLDQFENSDQIKFTSITDVPTSEFRGLRDDSESASVVVSTTKQEDGKIVNTLMLDGCPGNGTHGEGSQVVEVTSKNTQQAVSVHCHSVDRCSVFSLFLVVPQSGVV